MPPVLGVVEEQPRAGEGPVTQVRVLFRKVSDGWEPVHASGAPMRGSWTVCFDGKQRDFLETELERRTESALIGVHRPLPGEEVHFPGTRSRTFAGWLPGDVYRPMALSSHARCDDPARWRPAPLEGELWKEVADNARGQMHAGLCGGPNHDVRTGEWAPQLADIELVKSYASAKGERLVSLRSRTPATGLCDFVEGPSPFGSWLFAISPGGGVHLLGVGLTVVDAGDYDGDGASEVLTKYGGYNEDGYVLFSDGFERSVEWKWNYH